jgi:uncharacterized cupin superfamily protein
MSDYTIVNLGDVENVAPKFQMPDGMDVRFPKRHLGCKIGGIGVEKLAAGVRAPFGHTHTEQEEIYVIAEGSGAASRSTTRSATCTSGTSSASGLE